MTLKVGCRFVVLSSALVASLCGCGSPLCDATALAHALSEARPGQKVKIGACAIAGNFTVPTGVTLEGLGRDVTTISGTGQGAAILVTPGTPPGAVVDLAVKSAGGVGIVGPCVHGGGIDIRRVNVDAALGIGIAAEGVEAVTMTDVTVRGPVTRGNAMSLFGRVTVTATQSATHGLVLLKVQSATLTNVNVSGFAEFGALIVSSNTVWQGGGVADTRGTGLMADGGKITLGSVTLARTFNGFSLIPAYGAVFTSSVSVESTGLTVDHSEDYGMLHDAATARHTDLHAEGNSEAAVWLQHVKSFELSGQITGNRLAGVVAVSSTNVTVHDTMIARTSTAPWVSGETGRVDAGDGIQLVGAHVGAQIRNVTLMGNRRIGILLDLKNGTTGGMTFDNVQITATSTTERGLLAQDGTISPGWDHGVVRDAATMAADASSPAMLPIVGIVGPCDRPRIGTIAVQGLQGFLPH